MFSRKRKQQRDPNQAARHILDNAHAGITANMRASVRVLQNKIGDAPDDLAQEVVRHLEFLHTLAEGATALKKIVQPTKPTVVKGGNVGARSYVISEASLHAFVGFLVGHDKNYERLVVFSAVELSGGNTIVLTEPLHLPLSEQSMAGVAVHPGHFAAKTEWLERHGHKIWAMFHSHPTNGRDGTQPSARDLAHQQRLADFGMPHVIGGIASRDGEWFRIFNPAQDFALSLFGSGTVAIVEDTAREKLLQLKLTEARHAPVQPAAQAAQ